MGAKQPQPRPTGPKPEASPAPPRPNIGPTRESFKSASGTITIAAEAGSGLVAVTLSQGIFNIDVNLNVANARKIAEALDRSADVAGPPGRLR